MKILLKNKIKCNKCGDVIESKNRHDFVWCKCKSVAVDGGLSYLRRCGNKEDITEACEYREATIEEKKDFVKNNINDYLHCVTETQLNDIINVIENRYS